VTAKHVAKRVESCPFVIGMNSSEGRKEQFRANFDPDHPWIWAYHPTEPESVDVAVAPFAPAEYNILDVEWIHYPEMFATPEVIVTEGIGIGDEIAVIGLFTRFSGKGRHFPIARIGNLAMLPTERIPVGGFAPMEAYLAEGRSIGGLSGSPVFVRKTVNTTLPHSGDQPFAGTGRIYFIGLIHGHWDLSKDLSIAQAEAVNMGISIIVPAHKIWEVVNQPELAEQRANYDMEVGKEKLRAKDSNAPHSDL